MMMAALDFIRKIKEHSKFRQFLFKLICGKFAYREYEILILNFDLGGYHTEYGYELESMDYHQWSFQELKTRMCRNANLETTSSSNPQ